MARDWGPILYCGAYIASKSVCRSASRAPASMRLYCNLGRSELGLQSQAVTAVRGGRIAMPTSGGHVSWKCLILQ